MTPELISSAKSTAGKIRAVLIRIDALKTSIEHTHQQKAECQGKIDAAVSGGALEDEKNLAALSQENSRLLLFPTRIGQLETELTAKKKSLPDYVNSAHVIMGNVAVAVEKEMAAEVSKLLSKFISEEHRVTALTQEVLKFSDRLNAVRQQAGGFSPLDQQYASADADSIISMATHAANVLEGNSELHRTK